MIKRFCAAVAVATLTAFAAAPAVAQQPPPAAPSKAPPKAPAKSPAPAAPAAQAPAAAPQMTSGNSVGNQPVQLIYTPWFKVCQKAPQQQGAPKEVCITSRIGMLEIGQPLITAEVMTIEGEPKRMLRLTMPLGVALEQRTQFYIDTNTPKEAAFAACLSQGCLANYEADDTVIAAMKGGKNLISRAFDAVSGQLITLQVPVAADFAKVYDGPATDPAVLQQQQKQIQDIVQAAQQRAQQQQQQQQPGGAAPTAPAK